MVQLSATTVVVMAGVLARLVAAMPAATPAPEEPRIDVDFPQPGPITVTVTSTITIESCSSSSVTPDVFIQTGQGTGDKPEVTPEPEDIPNSGGDTQCTSICAAPTVTALPRNCPMLRCPMAKCIPKPEVTTTVTFNCPDGVCDFSGPDLKTADCDAQELTPVTVTEPCPKCGPLCAAFTTTAAVACGTSFVGTE